MIISRIVDKDHPIEITDEEIAIAKEASLSPVDLTDPENPPLTDEELAQMVRVGTIKYGERRKETVSLRLCSSTLKKAKAFGKGYTSLLSRILEDVLNDNSKLKKYL